MSCAGASEDLRGVEVAEGEVCNLVLRYYFFVNQEEKASSHVCGRSSSRVCKSDAVGCVSSCFVTAVGRPLHTCL